MAICIKCGTALPETLVFCSKCGSRINLPTTKQSEADIESAEQVRLCNTCEMPQPDMTFCDNCGYRVDDPCENPDLKPIKKSQDTELRTDQFQLTLERTPSYVGAAIPYLITVNKKSLGVLANGAKNKVILDQPHLEINISPSSSIFRFALVTPNLRLILRSLQQFVHLSFAPNMVGRIEFQVQGAEVLESKRYQ